MTAAKKLLLAVAIVAVGYGTAWFLDRFGVGDKPAWPARSTQSSEPRPFVAALPTEPVVVASGSILPSGARLVPDPKAQANSYFAARDEMPPRRDEAVEPLRPLAEEVGPISAAEVQVPELITAAKLEPTPRAKLRDEAPRALAAEPNAVSTIRRLPICDNGVSTSTDTLARSSSIPAAGVQPAQFTSDNLGPVVAYSATGGAAATASTSDNQHPTVAPPPWPPVAETDEPRKHIVIDGDSLAKLAGRYLDDPRRAAEIFELNRGVLRDPNLLPIGAELAIPSRTPATSNWTDAPQSYQPPVVAVHTPITGGLVPVRPIPRFSTVTPRAQLAAPRPAE